MPSFQKILAATDLSACAGTAVSFAHEIARRTHGQLTVLHVDLGLPEYTSMVLAGERTDRSAADQRRGAARQDLDQHLSTYMDAESPAIRVVVTGSAATEILTMSNELAADLIVIGTHGYGSITRALIGSVAEEVIRLSSRAVLSIRCRKPPLEPRFRRVTCAVNYTAASRAALASAIAFASAFDANVTAVHVVEGARADAAEESERLREWIGNEAPGVEPHVLLRRRNAAAALIEFAKRDAVDLLVVGAKRSQFAKQTTLGSTTSALTHRLRCPVLTVSV
jgi:nucleotide-binding universal stress UspA family protein